MRAEPGGRLSWNVLVGASFVPLLVKAADYALIGSYVPLASLALLGGFAALGLWRGGRTEVLAVRTWAVAIFLWGLARLAVMVAFLTTSVSEAHVENQFTPWYVVVSLAHAAVGVHLFRNVRRRAIGRP